MGAGPSRRRTITFFSSNLGKVREVRELLEPLGWRVAQGHQSLVEPQADRLEDVVRAKLAQVPRRAGWALVDDSGLFVPGLGGFPGVYSAYALRTLGPGGVLRLIGPRDRKAYFLAVVGLRGPEGAHLFTGRVDGTLAPRPTGRGGFGFDPIFIPRGERRTFAQMSSEEKNALSHRGRAVRALAKHLARAGPP